MRTNQPPLLSHCRVAVLGDLYGEEFAAARAWLKAHAEVCPVESLHEVAAVDFIVLACARRGHFNAAEVQRLRTITPLARIVALTSSWCDGPWRRAGDLLPGVAIVPWHRWTAWADVNLQQLTRRRGPSWSLPETTTADELAHFWSVQPLSENRGSVLIGAASSESADVLADVVRAGGFSPVSLLSRVEEHPADVRAILCEANDARAATLERIAELSRRYAPSPVVALINFPRSDDFERILATGAAALVGKPFTLHEILAQLEAVLGRSFKQSAVAA